MLRRLFAVLRYYSRQKRYRQIQLLIQVESLSGLILDLGGGAASFFSSFFPNPRQVILLEIDSREAHRAKNIQPDLQVIEADGQRLPFASGLISMTICNSVIEHVKNPDALAVEIYRVSQGYFLQTPSGKFPLETHSLVAIPFYNLVPGQRLRRLVCKLFGANSEYVDSVCYLSEQRLRVLFPEARLAYERVLGIKKSFYLYRSNADSK